MVKNEDPEIKIIIMIIKALFNIGYTNIQSD